MSKETQNNDTAEVTNQFAEWESTTDLFAENTQAVPAAKDVIPEAIKETVIKTEGEEEEPEEVDPAKDHDFTNFGESGDFEEEEDDIIAPLTTQAGKVDSKSTLEFLKEKGLVDYELEEGTELTPELADEILEDNWDESIDAAVEERIKDLPPGLKELIKYATKGGDFTELLGNMTKQTASGINKDTDMEVESNQIKVISQDLQEQGYDQEYIDGQIEYMKDSGKLKSISGKVFTKVLAKQDAEIEGKVQSANARKLAEKEKQRVYKNDITTQLDSLSDVKGLVLNKEDKQVLPSYISDANVKLQDGRTVTKFQQELFSIFGDKEQTILLAKLVRSKFDFSSITNKEITKFSREIKNNIQNTDTKLTGSKGSSQKQKKSLADLLD